MLRKVAASILGLLFLVNASTLMGQKRQNVKHDEKPMKSNETKQEIRLMTLDPGHFHAALVQKTMLEGVSPIVHVYAPAGPDLDQHMKRIELYNTRAEDPTRWEQKVYTGPDFLEKMLAEKPGNVVVLAGNNQKKIGYINASLNAGINVLSDKPMCIDSDGWEKLKAAFKTAEQKNVLLYDIMTERYEVTTMLQKALVNSSNLFGKLQKGTPDDPSVTKESVHHLFKYVSGKPLQRPGWFFDTAQQGEGIVDVSTHLVDLIMWESFPEQPIAISDIEMLRAKRWPTSVSREQFKKVTSLPEFPDFLKSKLDKDGTLPYFSNGEMTFKLRGIHSKVSVIWNFEAPEGTGDTHFSIMKGTKANVIIRQGKEENYRPEVYVEAAKGVDPKTLETSLKKTIADLQSAFPGLSLQQQGKLWHVTIPDKLRTNHEQHFGEVAEKYLRFLRDGKLPAWEVPNMITKYYVTTKALELARQRS